MNERAKIWIEREVFLKCIEDNPDGTKRFDKYKFAELIINECFDIVDDGDFDGAIYRDNFNDYFGIILGIEE